MLKKLGPYRLLFFTFSCSLGAFFAFRLALIFWQFSRVTLEKNLWMMFPLSLRMDFLTLCYLLGPLCVLWVALPTKWNLKLKKFYLIAFSAFFIFFVYMEAMTFSFMAEFDHRPDSRALDYWVHPKEVIGMLLTGYKFSLALIFLVVVAAAYFFTKKLKKAIDTTAIWPWWKQLLSLPLLGIVLFLGARSSLGHRPANISTASFSTNHIVNEITLNSSYSVLYALYRKKHQTNPFDLYGALPRAEIFERVKKNSLITDEKFLMTNETLLHEQKSPLKHEVPPNVIIVLEESFGAEYVGSLGGPPITPYYDELSKEGLAFTNLYATGTRTVRGIEATIGGFLPTPGESIVKLDKAKKGFFTLAQAFQEKGYSTNFIYAGESNFDEMKAFFLGNGIDRVYDQPVLEKGLQTGVWGLHDEDLFLKANELFENELKRPFFAIILTTSNHSPFDYPEGKIELYEGYPKDSYPNAIKYADYSIGKFFEVAKKSSYYANSLFLVAADHSTRQFGDDLIPLHKFHIPAFMIGPGVPKQKMEKLCSNIDLAPTLLHFTGLDFTHPMLGRNMMTLPTQEEGRSIMQYGKHMGYRKGNKVAILKPHMKIQTYVYENNKLAIEQNTDQELASDALAHILLPWILYSENKYKK